MLSQSDNAVNSRNSVSYGNLGLSILAILSRLLRSVSLSHCHYISQSEAVIPLNSVSSSQALIPLNSVSPSHSVITASRGVLGSTAAYLG